LEFPKLLPLLHEAIAKGDEEAAFFIQRRMVQAGGRAVTGAALVAYGMNLMQNMRATGAGPEPDKASLARKKVTGEAPRGAVRIPFTSDTWWFNLMRVPPVGLFIVAGAAMQEARENPDLNTDERFGAVWAALSSSVMEMPMLLGMKQLQEGLADPMRRGSAIIESFAKRPIPAIAQRVTKSSIDNQIADPKGPWQAIRSTMPGWADQVPVRINALGEPVQQEGGFLGAQTSLPVTRDRTIADAFMRALAESDFPLSAPGRKAGESDSAFQRRRVATGTKMGDLLRGEFEATGGITPPDSLGGGLWARLRRGMMNPLLDPELAPRIDTTKMSPRQLQRLHGLTRAQLRNELVRQYNTPESP